ncbi:hypothetical protein JYU34_021093 [Plutella xylostella]|uniref:Uncharacterized protein n=1 Tax=Plutella xylostella TaxID=51655 RepID=A0ABQ7PU18_PLUXY|nr:hypothetical protein JYU34_021093 [Plutella xylostella]
MLQLAPRSPTLRRYKQHIFIESTDSRESSGNFHGGWRRRRRRLIDDTVTQMPRSFMPRPRQDPPHAAAATPEFPPATCTTSGLSQPRAEAAPPSPHLFN